MIRGSMFAVFVLLFFSGCSNDPEVPQAVAIATSIPVEKADQEVLIASNPAGAQVLLKNAEVGKTPMKLLVRGDTNVVLKKEGYVEQAIMITPKSDPNIVVDLVESSVVDSVVKPVVVEMAAVPDTGAESGKRESPYHKKSKSKSRSKLESSAEPKPEPELKPEPEPELVNTAPAVAPAAKPTYNTMRELKNAIRAREITKAEYRMYQKSIRNKRTKEYGEVKAKYSAGKITKAEYKQQIKAIRIKYEG